MAFHWLMFFLVTAGVILTLKTLVGDPSIPMTERLQNELFNLSLVAAIFACLAPFFIVDTIRFSHRIVGPVSRLRAQLKELGTKGKANNIELRGNDFWQEVGAEFNAVNERITSMKNADTVSDEQESVTAS